ncbi:MAG: leucine-rich repeat protein, partial [Clostridia bacterium]|nr:leucine-rich repeat protein [Clostridia bacterium]
MVKKLTFKIAALGLCAVFAGGFGLATLDYGKDSVSVVSAENTAAYEDVTGKYSLDEVKEGLYNTSVSENISSLSGNGNVIVKLSGESVYDGFEKISSVFRGQSFSDYVSSRAGGQRTDELIKQHSKVLDKMRAAGIGYEFKYSYTALTNAFSVSVNYSDVKKIEKIDGVEAVYYSNKYEAPKVAVTTNDANVYKTGIYDSSDVEYKGEGMVVAVLDTGLDYTHDAFLNMPSEASWDEAYVASKFSNTLAKTSRMPSAEASDVYINQKVPYAFDYADNDCNVYPSYSTHGTHVAGIIAGKDDSKSFGDEKFIGVAPEAQLVIMKVFTDNLDSNMLGGADTADILAAINDCAVLGVDVVNMSLGSTGGFSSETTDEFLTKVYSSIEEMGISLVVAAGNEYSSGYGGGNGVNLASNPDSGTVGSPSTYYPALSVASINGQESPYFIANKDNSDGGSVSFITNAVDTYSNDIKFNELLLEKFSDRVQDGCLTLNYIVIGGVGRNGNYTAAIRREFASGDTIALVKRGDISFSEKVQNAKDAGAAGVIVYNHLSGDITMSLADLEEPIPTCSVNLNAGTAMVKGAVTSRGITKGTVTINASYTAGPFMSAFSGWGVTPDLKLKPEITAHGGEITSAVPGGYDTYSGTSMAAPNMAGAVALLRQHVKKTTGLTGKDLNARVNQILMSTATIALNPNGNPYSPRKQGAGLADINSAVNSEAYLKIATENGYSDKTKIELGDDVQKKGVYDAKFIVSNTSSKALKYKLSSYVFTETLAINKKTVEENAYMLKDDKTSMADVTFEIGGTKYSCGDEITVPANRDLEISVKVTLNQVAKNYLNESFENGMYVEGYFRLLKTENGAYTNLSVPFLAFYGDWSKAPLLDYSIYELAVTDADTSIEPEDKPVASARATTPLGLYYDGKYIMPLGMYLYNQSEEDVEIFPDSSKAAISMYDDINRRTIYQLYMIYGGLLRGAKTLRLTVTDAVTGEIVYDNTEHNVRKSYALGGNNVGSPIMVEMNPYEWGLANNREYVFRMQGTIDWKDGKANNDTFEFSFHVDYEAPSIKSYTVRYEPYTENKETKYRIFLDVNVYDNQYVQSLLPCYVKDNTLYLMTKYVVPVYSQQNSVTKVSLDITDFYDDYGDEIYLGVEDYAMNQSLYHLNLKNATKYSDSITFTGADDRFENTGSRTATTVVNGEAVQNRYETYTLNLSPNEAYKLTASVVPSDTFAYKLDWSSSAKSVATVYENEIFAIKKGTAIISVKDGKGLTKAQITVKVSGEAKSEPVPEKLSFRPIVNKDNYIQNISQSNTTVELYPNTEIPLKVDVEPWYVSGLEFEWKSSNPDVLSVDENGVITTHKKGVAYVTVSAVGYSRVSTTLRVNVVSEFHIVNYTLYGYYGSPDVVIPDELNIMYLDEDTFKDNRKITSLVLPKTLTEIPENAFKNCTGLKTVTIPSETTVIGKSAFEGCVSLEKIILRKFIDDESGDIMTGALTVANRGFANCISLKEIENPLRLTTVGREAFKGCTALKDLNVAGVAVAYENAFEDCTSLENITFSAFTNPSKGMFKNCKALKSVNYPMDSVAEGMFENCISLSTVNFTSDLAYIGESAFANTAISSLKLKGETVRIGGYAFKNCKNLESVTLSANTKVDFAGINPFGGCDEFTSFILEGNSLYSVDGGILYNADKTEILLVPEGITSVSLPSGVTVIGSNVFAGRSSLKSIDLNGVICIGDYAFAETGLTSVTLPASLKYLGKGAFKGCTLLSSADITQADVDEIPAQLFAGCASLKEIALPHSVKFIGNGAFENSVLETITFGGEEE